MSADKSHGTEQSASPPRSESPGAALASAFADLAKFAAEPSPLRPSRTRDFWALVGCNAIVFATSVCIMVLELTASRLIAKSVGQSLYTWTSVIGVVLAGISFGNFLGGWLADRMPPHKLLGYLFWSSSLLCLCIYPSHQIIGPGGRPDWASWPTWVVIVVAANFFLPALALGTISPVVASMALSRSARTGITLGNVYAWGAMGSIVGTFLTGFFLINSFGTQHIIWMTAAVLALMGILVAGGQWTFRTTMFFGWLQFVFWIGLFAAAKGSEQEDAGWFANVGRALHHVGLKLNVRGDQAETYHVESNYYSISVNSVEEKGDVVRALYLDHLTHSYFNPRKPQALYYDYELVYAAVTEQAASRWDRSTSVTLASFPSGISPERHLPKSMSFDPGSHMLTIHGAMNDRRRDQLLQLSSSVEYWTALSELIAASAAATSDGLISVRLERLPEEIVIPASLQGKVKFDERFSYLVASGRLTPDDIRQLKGLGPDASYLAAIERLYGDSRKISTFFIGGGGFVFPRWIEARFPAEPRIEVAEVDPAVKRAVQAEMGLKPDGETFVQTSIGDARNIVDDRIRANASRKAAGDAPILYDFVYGDAFNDFSVPWHLTTLEFTRKIRELLSPEGVYLVNIIDIFPRTEYPPVKETSAESERDDEEEVDETEYYRGRLPDALRRHGAPADQWISAPAPFESFQTFRESGNHKLLLGYRGPMSDETRNQLLKLETGNAEFAAAIASLHQRSRSDQAGRFLGSYVNTVSQVFPFISVFASEEHEPSDLRDTFVVVCSNRQLDLTRLNEIGEYWSGVPFAWMETSPEGSRLEFGQMAGVLKLARGMVLTDDYAPIDNLLVPVFADQ